MTSKEALWKIFETAFRQGNVIVNLREQYEQVEKDLEVLEILKKNSQYGEYYLSCDKNGKLEDGYLEIKIVIPDIKKKEFNKVKEWLENGI